MGIEEILTQLGGRRLIVTACWNACSRDILRRYSSELSPIGLDDTTTDFAASAFGIGELHLDVSSEAAEAIALDLGVRVIPSLVYVLSGSKIRTVVTELKSLSQLVKLLASTQIEEMNAPDRKHPINVNEFAPSSASVLSSVVVAPTYLPVVGGEVEFSPRSASISLPDVVDGACIRIFVAGDKTHCGKRQGRNTLISPLFDSVFIACAAPSPLESSAPSIVPVFHLPHWPI